MRKQLIKILAQKKYIPNWKWRYKKRYRHYLSQNKAFGRIISNRVWSRRVRQYTKKYAELTQHQAKVMWTVVPSDIENYEKLNNYNIDAKTAKQK